MPTINYTSPLFQFNQNKINNSPKQSFQPKLKVPHFGSMDSGNQDHVLFGRAVPVENILPHVGETSSRKPPFKSPVIKGLDGQNSSATRSRGVQQWTPPPDSEIGSKKRKRDETALVADTKKPKQAAQPGTKATTSTFNADTPLRSIENKWSRGLGGRLRNLGRESERRSSDLKNGPVRKRPEEKPTSDRELGPQEG